LEQSFGRTGLINIIFSEFVFPEEGKSKERRKVRNESSKQADRAEGRADTLLCGGASA
jgi:hypothetical protein